MTRKIKLRAWDINDKKMIVHERNFIPCKVTNFGILRLDACIEEDRWILLPTERFEIMQFTGLTDSTRWNELTEQEKQGWLDKGELEETWKGKEIWEGDILRVFHFTDASNHTHYLYHVVTWSEQHSAWYLMHKDNMNLDINERGNLLAWTAFRNYSWEVIGNIYEHPELLKED